uniref:Uncharacterized protein n=1 Tax=Panagrolaimus superbus TaxID=310955 RepID=A0A914Y3D5_9BILA
MRRSYSEDKVHFQNIVHRFYGLQNLEEEEIDYIHQRKTEIHDKCMTAYAFALDGVFQNCDQLDHISLNMAMMLWWFNKIELDMKHSDAELRSHNANLLAASFWALNQSIHATSRFARDVGYIAPVNDALCSRLVEKFLNVIFRLIENYRDFPHVVEEAMSTLEALQQCGHFHLQMKQFLKYFEKDMSNFSKRRQLFSIGAKSACNSVDHRDARTFVETALSRYREQMSALSFTTETFIEIIEIITGFADALGGCPQVDVYVYCERNAKNWYFADGHPTNGGYEDLIILMRIVKDSLDKLALSSCYDDDDEPAEMTILEQMGVLSLKIFVPHITAIRISVPDVLKSFSNMLQAITAYSSIIVIDFVKNPDDELLYLLNFIISSSQTADSIAQSIAILDSQTVEGSRRKFVDNYGPFRRVILDKLRYNPEDMEMKSTVASFIRYNGDPLGK